MDRALLLSQHLHHVLGAHVGAEVALHGALAVRLRLDHERRDLGAAVGDRVHVGGGAAGVGRMRPLTISPMRSMPGACVMCSSKASWITARAGTMSSSSMPGYTLLVSLTLKPARSSSSWASLQTTELPAYTTMGRAESSQRRSALCSTVSQSPPSTPPASRIDEVK